MPRIKDRVVTNHQIPGYQLIPENKPPVFQPPFDARYQERFERPLSVQGNPSPKRGDIPTDPNYDFYSHTFYQDDPKFIRFLPAAPDLALNRLNQALVTKVSKII